MFEKFQDLEENESIELYWLVDDLVVMPDGRRKWVREGDRVVIYKTEEGSIEVLSHTPRTLH